MKDLEILKKYESFFTTALKSDYIRAIWDSDMNVMIPIYEKWTGTKYTGCFNCSKSKLEFMKKLGKLYFKKIEENGNNKNIEQPTVERASKVGRKANSNRKKPIKNS